MANSEGKINPNLRARCQEVDDEIERLFLSGQPIIAISKLVPASDRSVRAVIKERQLTKPKRLSPSFTTKLPHHKYRSPEVDDEIVRLFLTGESACRIARAIPIGEHTVRRCLKERGLMPETKKQA